MHLDFHRQNSTCLMFSTYKNDIYIICSIGYDLLASLLLPEIEDENDNVEMGYSLSTSSEDSSSTLREIDGYVAQKDYPFKDSGLAVDLFGSCNGCVFLWFHDNQDDQEQFICLWNPATSEYKKISEAPKRYRHHEIRLHAFFYDPTTDDYKFLIAAPFEDDTNEMNSLVHVYSLASDSWKSFLTPYGFISGKTSSILFKGDLHLLAIGQTRYSIVSLDIKNEEFK
ncbi:uncharacterized protein LOC113280126 [Papaver somniferum]|uniref:uncharacterized protein LOC113280126 n=1 Tax=Papaver somniferum TaxID=3469 RepID=UPI000E704A3B|nr:uncharacterized protein LOC113280126 [Papaver somniferum]